MSETSIPNILIRVTNALKEARATKGMQNAEEVIIVLLRIGKQIPLWKEECKEIFDRLEIMIVERRRRGLSFKKTKKRNLQTTEPTKYLWRKSYDAHVPSYQINSYNISIILWDIRDTSLETFRRYVGILCKDKKVLASLCEQIDVRPKHLREKK